MYINQDADISDLIVVCNTNVHKKLNIDRESFLEKVKPIEQIRSAINRWYSSYYITSIDEHRNLKLLYDILNYGVFPKNDASHVFAIAIKPKLFEWFTSNEFAIIEKQIITWMASIYFFNPHKREIYDDQFYKPVLEEVKRIINFKILKLVELKVNYDEKKTISIYDVVKEPGVYDPIELYNQICISIYGKTAPKLLSTPFTLSFNSIWGVDRYNFSFVESYLTNSDWRRIVLEGDDDNLFRAESRKDLWVKWKHTFSLYDITKRNIYSFYLHSDDSFNKVHSKSKKSGSIYLMRNPTLEEGIFKIGLTTKTTNQRAKGLSNTSIPDKYYVMCDWFVDDCVFVEKRLQDILKSYRVDPKREFFKFDHEDIKGIISIISNEIKKIETSF